MIEVFDTRLLLFIQQLFGESSRAVWDVITVLGNPAVVVCVITFVMWFKGTRLALMLLAAGMVGGIIVELLKIIIAEPRPYYHILEAAVWRSSDGFGMPSGHAAGAVTLWGMLAVLVNRKWFWFVACVLVFLIGLSRVYFAVHSPSQVVLGWGIGIMMVWVVIRGESSFTDWFCLLGPGRQIALALLTTILLAVTHNLVASQRAADFQTPEHWEQRYGEAADYEVLSDSDLPFSEGAATRPQFVLFRIYDNAQIGFFLGVWLLAICAAKFGGYSSGSIKESCIITAVGLLAVSLLVPLLLLVRGIDILETLIWAVLPAGLGLGLTQLVHRRMTG